MQLAQVISRQYRREFLDIYDQKRFGVRFLLLFLRYYSRYFRFYQK